MNAIELNAIVDDARSAADINVHLHLTMFGLEIALAMSVIGMTGNMKDTVVLIRIQREQACRVLRWFHDHRPFALDVEVITAPFRSHLSFCCCDFSSMPHHGGSCAQTPSLHCMRRRCTRQQRAVCSAYAGLHRHLLKPRSSVLLV